MKNIKNYPRPQFVRNHWLNLNGEWNFLFDDENQGEKEKFYNRFPPSKKIIIPFTYETKMSGICDERIHQNIWYQKEISITRIEENSRVILHFEGSDYITKLWINGNYVGMNRGGYHRFSFDITAYLHCGNNNFTIKVEDSLSREQPRGKQRYKTESWKCWYIQSTGIWKTLWLEKVSKEYLMSSKVTPDYDDKNVNIILSTNINQDFQDYKIEIEILYKDCVKFNGSYSLEESRFECNIDISDDIKYWSLQTPNLYDVIYRLYKKDILIDEVFSYFGVRKISIQGSKILLNNQELYLRMILDQGYWKDSHLTPPDDDALLKDINLAISFGYTGIRKHQKIEDERFLYWCDMKGILVWNEMPNCYIYTDVAVENFMTEWIYVVKQNYNHPCIMTWVPINESWGIPSVKTNVQQQNYANALYYLTKSVDRTRPVISNDGWEHTISDIVTIHDYKQDSHLLYEEYNDSSFCVLNNEKEYNGIHRLFSGDYGYHGQPVIMSEYGGIALKTEKGWGYGKQVKNEEEIIKRFYDLTIAIKNTPYISGYCYTQLSDVQQEKNGLVDEKRNNKFSSAAIKIIQEINNNRE